MSSLQSEVLVLNSGWIPIDTISVKDAMILLIRGAARAVDVEDYSTHDFESWADLGKVFKGEQFVLTPKLKIPVPDVVLLEAFNKVPLPHVVFSRSNLLQRDQYLCQYCSKQLTTKNFTIDHIIPKSKGGRTNWVNCVISCEACNKRKRDRTPEQANMKLLKVPTQPPRRHAFIAVSKGRKVTWDKFLNDPKTRDAVASQVYWNAELKD